MPFFQIQETTLQADLDPRQGDNGFLVASNPRPYRVEWISHLPIDIAIRELFRESKHLLVLIDALVADLYFRNNDVLTDIPVMEVHSTERLKTIEGALEVCRFLDQNGATKASTLIVIGGGIVQDVAGFAACIFKRGIPWIYVPSTFLAQSDSGMGSKAGLNYNGAKNILALFSAPRRVVIHTGFLGTLGQDEILSGLGECFRLCATGGPEFLTVFRTGLQRYFNGDTMQLNDLLVTALAVKRAVIEHDEFELNERRAMNYGHSVGHALEALTQNAIPHGTAVALGMLIENEISITEGCLHPKTADELAETARPLISRRFIDDLRQANLTLVVDVLAKDKKSEGKQLQLALLHEPGLIRFHSFSLDDSAYRKVEGAVANVLDRLSASAASPSVHRMSSGSL